MSRATAYLVVLVAAGTPWLEVLFVVPAGIVAGLSPVPVVLVATVGNVLTILPVVLAGEAFRARLQRGRRREAATSDPQPEASAERDADGAPSVGRDDDRWSGGARGRGRRLFDRYGLPGLALLGPLVTGIHLAAAVAVGAGAPRRATLLWLSAGVAVWSAVTGVVTVLGVDAFVDPDRLPDLFGAL